MPHGECSLWWLLGEALCVVRCRVVELDPSKVMELGGAETHLEAWDAALAHSNSVYRERMHNLWYIYIYTHWNSSQTIDRLTRSMLGAAAITAIRT